MRSFASFNKEEAYDARFSRSTQIQQVRVELGQNQRGADELSAGTEVALRDVDSTRVVLIFPPAEREESAGVNEGAHALTVASLVLSAIEVIISTLGDVGREVVVVGGRDELA